MDTISRRQACALLGAASLASIAAAGKALTSGIATAQAEESTLAALGAAQEQYAAVQAQIDQLAAEAEALNIELSNTLDAIEVKNGEIETTKAALAQTQSELEECQDQLAIYVSSAYKSGPTSELDVLLSSASYEELFQNIYYLTKINDSTTALIEHTKEVKQQLTDQQAELEAQYAELEALRDQQQWQLSEIQDRKDSAYYLLSSLGEEVAALTDQYNQELIAQAEAAAAAAAAAEAAASGGGDSGGSYDGGSSGGSGGTSYGGASASAVVNACYSTPSPGAGWCAAWVTYVFQNAGVGSFYGDACDMYSSWCYSSDQGSIQPGMIVAVSTHSGSAAGQIYGHIGIYVGGGTVMDNIGYIRSIDLGSWVSYYGDTVTPRWGWLGGVVLY